MYLLYRFCFIRFHCIEIGHLTGDHASGGKEFDGISDFHGKFLHLCHDRLQLSPEIKKNPIQGMATINPAAVVTRAWATALASATGLTALISKAMKLNAGSYRGPFPVNRAWARWCRYRINAHASHRALRLPSAHCFHRNGNRFRIGGTAQDTCEDHFASIPPCGGTSVLHLHNALHADNAGFR